VSALEVNGRRYRIPTRPVVTICVDGCDPAYLDAALAAGVMPTVARFRESGFFSLARCVIPSFTNPNNLSIVTGVPPSVHGICGNYFYDSASGQEIMMNDPCYLRCATVLAELSRAGVPTAIVTAKDKLRRLLGKDLQGICFSAEKADEVTVEDNGIENVTQLVEMPQPAVYSAELSEFVVAAGLALLRRGLAQVMYLSLTDYVQHTHPPADPVSLRFAAMLDRYFAAFDDLGAIIGITADHGMNAKVRQDGTPNVIYLGPILDKVVGVNRSRVILPITDPYVVHHGALGSFATVYFDRPHERDKVRERLASLSGITIVYDREAACARFELPPDRIGDLVVLSDGQSALGKFPHDHDLSQLAGPLRSHGGLAEQTVPFLINQSLKSEPDGESLRNFDVLDCVLNRVE
jgi:phosphonoacetate hydrolase